MILDTNLDNFFPALLLVPYSFITVLGPLIFLYTKALTEPEFKLTSVSLHHFVPVLAEVILQMLMIIQAISTDQLIYNTAFYFYITPVTYLWTAVSIFIYLKRSLEIITNHEVQALSNYSNLKDVTLNWLKKLIRYYRFFWMVWMPFAVVFLLFFRFQLMYLGVVGVLYLLMLMLTYLTLWIGMEGFTHSMFIFIKPDSVASRTIENKNFSLLTEDDIHRYVLQIKQLMTVDQMFLSENLTLREMALRMHTDPNLISHILNKHMDSSFHDFVNSYRIAVVKDRLNDPTYKHMTLLGIALDSGFNSKTTFNRVFKQMTGLTPTEFLKTQEKKRN